MLDVHPPHEAAHTWKDFFIHVATICVGLLIAVGLEQTVEWLHHKSEVRETRRLLKEERADNVERFHRDVTFARRLRAEMENNLRIFQYLQQHPGTPLEKLPGVILWVDNWTGSSQAAWLSAKQNNVLALMPQAEVEDSRLLYDLLTKNDEAGQATNQAISKAYAYQFFQPDPTKLTPAQVETEIPLIQECLRLTDLREQGLSSIGLVAADFAPGPSSAELKALRRQLSTHPSTDFPAAWAFTNHDLDSAEALDATDRAGILFAKETADRGADHIEEIYQHVHSKYPDFKPQDGVLEVLGYHLMDIGDLPSAIAVLKLNVQLHPDLWYEYDRLGKAYAKSGQKKLAIENYQHAHQLDPTAPSPIEALAKLQK
jgi:tetratricopeptide (TPR) repeat protein